MEQLKKYLLILCCALFASCATVKDRVQDVQSKVFNGNFNEAATAIDNNSFLKKDKNKLLFLLEKGKIEHLSGNYEASNALFEQAYTLIDDKIKSSVGQSIASKLTSPLAEPYKGEDFEKVMVHYYKALNFYYLGQDDAALVEARRINNVLKDMNVRYENKKNLYQTDVFSHILQGIIHENLSEYNDAYISYKNAVDVFLNDKNKEYFGVQIPYQLQTDFLRMCLKMNFKNEYEQYKSKFQYKEKIDSKTQKSELVVLWENGTGPYKSENRLTMAGGMLMSDNGDGDSFSIPIPAGLTDVSSIAMPKYLPGETYYDQAIIANANKNYNLEKVQDLYPIAKQCLKDRMGRELTGMITRFASKKLASAGVGAIGNKLFGGLGGSLVKLGANAASSGLEKADTRNWQLLPATISYTRIPIQNDTIITVSRMKKGEVVLKESINIKPFTGIKLINLYDLGNSSLTSTNIKSSSIKNVTATNQSVDIQKNNSENTIDKKAKSIEVEKTNSKNEVAKNESYTSTYESKENNTVYEVSKNNYQNQNMEEQTAKRTRFGFLFGLNLASLTDNDSNDDELVRTDVVFNAGLELITSMNKNFALKYRLLYSMEGGNFYNSDYDIDFKLNYLRTEILANFYLSPDKFYIHAGPSLGYAISAQYQDNLTGDTEDLTEIFSESSAKFKNFEYGINAGIGGVLFKKLILEASYHLGLSPIITGSNWQTSTGDKNVNKNRVLNLKMGYRF